MTAEDTTGTTGETVNVPYQWTASGGAGAPYSLVSVTGDQVMSDVAGVVSTTVEVTIQDSAGSQTTCSDPAEVVFTDAPPPPPPPGCSLSVNPSSIDVQAGGFCDLLAERRLRDKPDVLADIRAELGTA